MTSAKQGELAILVSPKGKRYMFRFPNEGESAKDFHTHDGRIDAVQLEQSVYGRMVHTHLGKPYRVLRPTLHDLVKGVKRQTQIIYPKDIGYICMRLGVGPGRRIIEAGSGSGSLTLALSWYCGAEGTVYTYEQRPEFAALCRRNLEWAGVGANVEQFERDIATGFEQTDVDGLFLDVRTPWEYLSQAAHAVAPGSPLGFLLPTTNQVCRLLEALERGPFAAVEVLEILVRRYKTVAERFRPDDRMVAHTGFLIFCRHQPLEETTAPEPADDGEQETEDAPDPDPAS